MLSKSYKTDIDNYLSPSTAKQFVYPDNDNVVTWHEQIPGDLDPGSYLLRIVQTRFPKDTEGAEIFSKTFLVT